MFADKFQFGKVFLGDYRAHLKHDLGLITTETHNIRLSTSKAVEGSAVKTSPAASVRCLKVPTRLLSRDLDSSMTSSKASNEYDSECVLIHVYEASSGLALVNNLCRQHRGGMRSLYEGHKLRYSPSTAANQIRVSGTCNLRQHNVLIGNLCFH